MNKKIIGKKVVYKVDGLNIHCKITDSKSVYGRVIYKLEPICGSGHKWTNKIPGEELEC
jgi:hypothetical protein